ncbi:MAG: FecR domain-containing protein [Betaproteobacteria bacterium]|nr:FecR domain-containing protein [Betaproteobacteria bacterium]
MNNMKTIGFLKKFFLFASLVMSSATWAQVATVVEMTGSVQAIPAAGAPRDLRKGDTLNQGDTVTTKAGAHAVLVFEDKQSVVLTGESRFKISNYVYNKMEPAKSSILFELLDGGMRAISGLIGKAKPENVTYKAANATIGIRGTIVNTAIKNKVTTATVETEIGPDGRRVATSIVVTFDNNRRVTVPAGSGFYIDAAGQVQVKPAADVIKSLGESPLVLIIRAVLNTAAQSEVQRALTQAFRDSGATGIQQQQQQTQQQQQPPLRGSLGSGGSTSGGSGGGSISGR